jgi:hypothetical protein
MTYGSAVSKNIQSRKQIMKKVIMKLSAKRKNTISCPVSDTQGVQTIRPNRSRNCVVFRIVVVSFHAGKLVASPGHPLPPNQLLSLPAIAYTMFRYPMPSLLFYSLFTNNKQL